MGPESGGSGVKFFKENGMRTSDTGINVDRGGDAPGFDARDFRNAMGQFATGVVVIATSIDGHTHGMTANAFMSGSLEPPLIIVSVACNARMHSKIAQGGRFGVSMLSEHQEWCSNHFAGKPAEGRQPEFELLSDAPVLAQAKVKIAAELRHVYACGDHTLFVGEVKSLEHRSRDEGPLLFHGGRYARLAGSDSMAMGGATQA